MLLVNSYVNTMQTKQNTTRRNSSTHVNLKPGFEAITAAVEERIDVFGSEGSFN